ncbi:MAG: hypothetical protein AAGB93_21575 [Planctomycetota bacterium]
MVLPARSLQSPRWPLLVRVALAALVSALCAPGLALAQNGGDEDGSEAPEETSETAQAGAAEQGPDPAQAQLPALPPPAWVPRTQREQELLVRHGDHHIAVVGSELITRDEIFSVLQTRQFDDPTVNMPDLSDEDRHRIRFSAALEQNIEARLKVQGGRNQGYEPDLVRAIRDNFFNRKIQEWGGPTQANERIARMGMTPDQFRSVVEQRLLAQFWEDSVTGRSVGATGRRFVDPYVRPGKLWSRYRTLLQARDPKIAEIIGKAPPQTVLERLLIDASQNVSVDEAKRLAEALRENIVDEVVTFEQAWNEYGNYREQNRFLSGATDDVVGTFERIHPEVDLEPFVRSGKIGELSPVVRIDLPDGPTVFVIYRLSERIAAKEALPFLDQGLQDRLTESIKEGDARVRVARGLGELVQTTFVAPEDIRKALLDRGRRSAPIR